MGRINIENLRKQAKRLHRQLTSADPDSITRVREGLPRLSGAADADVPDANVTLQEVQHVLAVELGYKDWKAVLADVSDLAPRKRESGTLYIRPNLAMLTEEAEFLLRTVGDGMNAARVRRSLPRLAPLTDAEIAAGGVSLAEARLVIAVDYGFADWADLESDLHRWPPLRTIEDFANLDSDEIREVIARVGRDKLAVVFKAVSERFKDRFKANMSEDEWQALADATEELGPMHVGNVEAEQGRLVQLYRTDDQMV